MPAEATAQDLIDVTVVGDLHWRLDPIPLHPPALSESPPLGRLSRDDIQGVIARHLNAIKYCYERFVSHGVGVSGDQDVVSR